MLMYNLLEYRDNYSKITGSLWQCYRDNQNYHLADSQSFKSNIEKKKQEKLLLLVMNKMLK